MAFSATHSVAAHTRPGEAGSDCEQPNRGQVFATCGTPRARGPARKARKAKHGAKRGEAHVRLYGYELQCPAYRTLSPDARALLIELRALYNGRGNLVFLSLREMMNRVGIGQRRAQSARDELLERGWIVVVTPGGFSRKDRHATEFALTNEPFEQRDGAVARRDYMRWQPSPQSTVAKSTADGSQRSCRASETAEDKAVDSSRSGYRRDGFCEPTVAPTAAQILLPPERSDPDVLLWGAMRCADDERMQRMLIAGWFLMGGNHRMGRST